MCKRTRSQLSLRYGLCRINDLQSATWRPMKGKKKISTLPPINHAISQLHTDPWEEKETGDTHDPRPLTPPENGFLEIIPDGNIVLIKMRCTSQTLTDRLILLPWDLARAWSVPKIRRGNVRQTGVTCTRTVYGERLQQDQS